MLDLHSLRYQYERETEHLNDPPSFEQWLGSWRLRPVQKEATNG